MDELSKNVWPDMLDAMEEYAQQQVKSRIRFSIDEHGGEMNVIELDLDDANELSQMIEMLIEKLEEFEKGKL